MLWTKAWFEVRWRLVFALGIVLAPLGGLYYRGGGTSPAEAATVMSLIAFLWLFAAVFLAAAGIRTQSPIQGTKGLHGSTHFTLSLPVSRLQLLTVRSLVGLASVFGTILISSAAAWALFPMIRASSTVPDYLRWVVTLCCVASAFHAISVFNATFLEEQWQVWGTVAMVGALKWLTLRFPPPPSVDVFRVMTEASPLLTHAMPWIAIAVSLGFAAAAFVAAVKVAEAREY